VKGRSRAGKILLFLLLLCIAIGLILPFILDPALIKNLFVSQIEQQVGRRITVGDARLGLLPSIRLELFDVAVTEPDGTAVFFTARHVDLVLRAWPLLKGEVVGKRLTVEQPRVELKRLASGTWNVAQGGVGASPSTDEPETHNPLSILFAVQQVTLQNGTVVITDEFRDDGLRVARVESVDAVLTVGASHKEADLRLSGAIPGSQGTSSIGLTGRLSYAAKPVGIAQPDALSVLPAFQFDGIAEFANLNIYEMADFFGPRPVPPKVEGFANLRSDLSVVPGVVGYDLILSNLRVDLGRITMMGNANVAGLLSEQPTFALTFGSNAVSLEELLVRFPVQWVDPRIQAVMMERKIEGTVEILSARVTGVTKPEPVLSMTGELKVSQGQALVGESMTLAQDLAATIAIEPDRVRVMDLTGTYGAMQVTKGRATILLAADGPTLEMDLTGSMAAGELVSTLARGASEQVGKLMHQLREIHGTVAVLYRLAGPLSVPGGLHFSGGDFQLQDVGFSGDLLPMPVSGMYGTIRALANGVEVDHVGGKINGGQFEVNGMVTEDGRLRGVTAFAKVGLLTLLRILKVDPAADMELQGSVQLGAMLSGTLQAPKFQVTLDGTDTSIHAPGLLKKPMGKQITVSGEGMRTADGTVILDRVELELLPIRVSGKGKLSWSPTFKVDGALVSSPISLAALPEGMSLGGLTDGILEVSLDIRGKGPQWKSWQYAGWVALTDGLYQTPKLEHQVKDLYVRVHLLKNGMEIKRLSLMIDESTIRASGVIRNLHTIPDATLELESNDLDIDLLIPKGERSPVRDALEWLAAESRVRATFTVAQAHYKTLQLSDLSGTLEIKDQMLLLKGLTGTSGDGRLDGHLFVQLPTRQPLDAELAFRIAGIPFEQVTQLTSAGPRLVTGTLSASGKVSSHGRHPEGLLSSVNGHVDFEVDHGRIEKGTVVPKILTILNLPVLLQGKVDLSKSGLPFDKMIGSWHLTNGVIREDKMIVDSPVLKMSAAGTYNMVTDSLDVVVVTSPLGSYSDFLKKIPLFGRLLAGERQSIDTAMFQATGSLKNPDVRYLPIESLTTGIAGVARLAFDVLVNTIKLPVELLTPEETRARETSPTEALPEVRHTPIPPPVPSPPSPGGT
jgi:hypothetical protein